MLGHIDFFNRVVMDVERYLFVRAFLFRNSHELSRVVLDSHLNLVHGSVVCDTGNLSGIFG